MTTDSSRGRVANPIGALSVACFMPNGLLEVLPGKPLNVFYDAQTSNICAVGKPDNTVPDVRGCAIICDLKELVSGTSRTTV